MDPVPTIALGELGGSNGIPFPQRIVHLYEVKSA